MLSYTHYDEHIICHVKKKLGDFNCSLCIRFHNKYHLPQMNTVCAYLRGTQRLFESVVNPKAQAQRPYTRGIMKLQKLSGLCKWHCLSLAQNCPTLAPNIWENNVLNKKHFVKKKRRASQGTSYPHSPHQQKKLLTI